jgi:hypothetical protein
MLLLKAFHSICDCMLGFGFCTGSWWTWQELLGWQQVGRGRQATIMITCLVVRILVGGWGPWRAWWRCSSRCGNAVIMHS